MQDINLLLFNDQDIKDLDDLECRFMDAFSDFSQEFLWKFEGISLVCLKLEKARAISLVKKIWAQYSFIFYKTLTSGTKREAISVLYSLIQMASLSSVIANDLILNFNFNLKLKTPWTVSRTKCSQMIYDYESYIKDYDTRSLFILFLSTLVRKSEVFARTRFLQSGLLGQVFPGLEKDTEYIQNIFLETLAKYIVDPDGVPRNLKISILSTRNLEKIALLRNSLWFLKHVCTRPGQGVCYKDMGWYPPEKENVKVYNKILSDFILGLKVLKTPGHKELLLEILGNCPELVKGYASKLQILPIDQFLHQDWENAMNVITEIVNLPVPVNFGASLQLPPPVSGFIDSIIPSCFTSSISTKGLQHSNTLIKVKIAEFLCIGLSKLDKVIKELLARSDKAIGNEWSECVDELLEHIQMRIPTWQLIVSYHHSCISDESEKHWDLKNFAYRLVLFYQKFYTRSINESNFNYGKLILQNMQDFPLGIQYTFLEIMGNVKEFKWWIVGDNSDSYLKKLLDYFVSCKNQEIKDVALGSLVSCLSNSTLFVENSDYLHILLSVLRTGSKSHQNTCISFLDKSISDAEKNSSRLSSVKESYNNLALKCPIKISCDAPYFCLYWLTESLVPILASEKNGIQYIILFFTRLILEQLYSIEETGDAIVYFGSHFLTSLSKFNLLSEILNPFQDALKIAQMYSETGDEIVLPDSIKKHHNFSGLAAKIGGNQELDFSNLFNQHSIQDILHVAYKKDINLSSELIQEIVSVMCVYRPVHHDPGYSKLNPAILHFLPTSLQFEYAIHTSDVSDMISKVKDLLDTKVLRFIFMHAILLLRRAIDFPDAQRIKMCGSVLISVIERAILLNYTEKIICIKAYNALLSNAFDGNTYSKLLKNDVFIVSIFGIVSKLLQIQNTTVHGSLSRVINTVTDSWVKEFSTSFPNVADIEILNLVKNVRNSEMHLEILDAAHSKLDFDNFCWVLDSLLFANDSDSFPGRYISLICTQCILNPSEKCFDLLNRLLTPSGSKNAMIHSDRRNIFGAKLMILDQELAKDFLPKLAKNLSAKYSHVISYFINQFPGLWDLFLNQTGIEGLEIDVVLILLGCFLPACSTIEYPYIWNDFVKVEVKLLINQLWDSSKDRIMLEITESLLGRKVYDSKVFRSGSICSALFGIPQNFLQKIIDGIPTMSCSRNTLVMLRDILPQLRILSESPKGKCLVLAILLRILRGYLIFMKDKESISDVQLVVNEIVALARDIKIGELTVVDGIDKDMMKYISNFVVTVLKSYFDNHILISCIKSLWEASYKFTFNLIPGDQLLDMVITHSKFNELMDSHDIRRYGLIQYQLALLIKSVMETNPVLFCQIKYLEKIIPLYNGTVKASDRILLSIFGLFETRLGISALRWIQDAWTNKGSGDILLSFDISKMIQTLSDFPIDQNFEDILNDDFNVPSFTKTGYYLYDISFIIPFAASMLFNPGNSVDLSLFIKSNILGIITMGLSSTSEKTRIGSSLVLSKFYELLTVSNLKERTFLIILFDSLKNAIISETKVPPRIPSIIAHFVAQSSVVLINSESLMYPLINRFLLQRPILDLKDIPMFYERMYSSSEFHRYERVWLLRLLSSGIMNDNDYYILKRRHAVDILFGFYYSSICDSQMKSMILELIYKASKQTHIAGSIIMRSSILTFFHSICLGANFIDFEEHTLCIPTILSSYGSMCLESKSKSSHYSSCLSSIITTMSFYLRLLTDSFDNLKNKRMGYGLLFHVLNLCEGLVYNSTHESILGTSDIRKIMHIIDLYDQENEDYTIPEKAVTPSRMIIEELLPTEYLGSKEDLKSQAVKWLFTEAVIGLENPHFLDILRWISDIVVQDNALEKGFGKWLISCRLIDKNQSFKSIYQCSEWEAFMKKLYLICDSNYGSHFKIYSSLLMLIIRDLDYCDPGVLELVSKVPAPRKILHQSFIDDYSPNQEIIFDRLRKIVWNPSRML